MTDNATKFMNMCSLHAMKEFWGYIFVFVGFVLSVPWFLMAIVLASMYDLYKDEFKVSR